MIKYINNRNMTATSERRKYITIILSQKGKFFSIMFQKVKENRAKPARILN